MCIAVGLQGAQCQCGHNIPAAHNGWSLCLCLCLLCESTLHTRVWTCEVAWLLVSMSCPCSRHVLFILLISYSAVTSQCSHVLSSSLSPILVHPAAKKNLVPRLQVWLDSPTSTSKVSPHLIIPVGQCYNF